MLWISLCFNVGDKMMEKTICECGRKKLELVKKCSICRENDKIKEIWDRSKEDGEITYEKYVICPYCGHHYGEDDLYESTELTCDECGEDFKLEIDYDINYSTYTKE